MPHLAYLDLLSGGAVCKDKLNAVGVGPRQIEPFAHTQLCSWRGLELHLEIAVISA